MRITNRGVILTPEEKEAVNKAHDIMVEKFTEAGQTYDYKLRETVEYWLYGALYTTGIEGMMKIAREARIAENRRESA